MRMIDACGVVRGQSFFSVPSESAGPAPSRALPGPESSLPRRGGVVRLDRVVENVVF